MNTVQYFIWKFSNLWASLWSVWQSSLLNSKVINLLEHKTLKFWFEKLRGFDYYWIFPTWVAGCFFVPLSGLLNYKNKYKILNRSWVASHMILVISGYPGQRFYSSWLTLSLIYLFWMCLLQASAPSPLSVSTMRYKIKANNSATSAVNCYVRKFLQKYLEKGLMHRIRILVTKIWIFIWKMYWNQVTGFTTLFRTQKGQMRKLLPEIFWTSVTMIFSLNGLVTVP